MTDGPRVLHFDIETRPMVVELWNLHGEQHVGLNQVREFGGTICIGYKWGGDKKVSFLSDWQHGHRGMLERFHELWCEADALCGYNSKSFDEKKLKGEFVKEGLPPPPPIAHVDVFKTVRSQFGFDSKKLDHVADLLGVGRKVQHEGHALWSRVLKGDEAAQRKMERYCKQDVRLLERVYDKLLPWLTNYPHMATIGADACPKCSSHSYQKRGYDRTRAFIYERLRCNGCGSWRRGSRVKAAA